MLQRPRGVWTRNWTCGGPWGSRTPATEVAFMGNLLLDESMFGTSDHSLVGQHCAVPIHTYGSISAIVCEVLSHTRLRPSNTGTSREGDSGRTCMTRLRY